MDSMLAKALRYAPRTSERERLFILAEEAHYRGRIREFRRIGEELLQKYPTFVDFYERMGGYYYFRREYDRALPYYRTWGELSNYSLRALTNLIHMFEYLGEADSAQYYFKKHRNSTLMRHLLVFLRAECISDKERLIKHFSQRDVRWPKIQIYLGRTDL